MLGLLKFERACWRNGQRGPASRRLFVMRALEHVLTAARSYARRTHRAGVVAKRGPHRALAEGDCLFLWEASVHSLESHGHGQAGTKQQRPGVSMSTVSGIAAAHPCASDVVMFMLCAICGAGVYIRVA